MDNINTSNPIEVAFGDIAIGHYTSIILKQSMLTPEVTLGMLRLV